MTVVSGDSLGHVQFWDGSLGTLLHSFTAHIADVMALALLPTGPVTAGADGSISDLLSVVSCSLDGKVQVYKPVPGHHGEVQPSQAVSYHNAHGSIEWLTSAVVLLPRLGCWARRIAATATTFAACPCVAPLARSHPVVWTRCCAYPVWAQSAMFRRSRYSN